MRSPPLFSLDLLCQLSTIYKFMQLVVPSAVKNAVSAATTTFTASSINFCFFIFLSHFNSALKVSFSPPELGGEPEGRGGLKKGKRLLCGFISASSLFSFLLPHSSFLELITRFHYRLHLRLQEYSPAAYSCRTSPRTPRP